MAHNHGTNWQSGSWSALAEQALPIRLKVFVEEQAVPQEIEVDEYDALATHVIALDADGLAVGTGRLVLQNDARGKVFGRIGRMAVLQAFRNQSVGTTLMHALIDLALTQNVPHLRLNARMTAIGFYERFGFKAQGDVFDDAGSPHIEMARDMTT